MSRDLAPAALAEHRPRLVRIAVRLLGCPHAAEDLVHDTFVRVLRSQRQIEGDALAYLVRALRNTHFDDLRAKRRRYETTPFHADAEPADPHAEQRPIAGVHAREVLAAIADLPAPHRHAVALVDVWGLSYLEAARNLGVPAGTVQSRASRGRARVARALETRGPGALAAA